MHPTHILLTAAQTWVEAKADLHLAECGIKLLSSRKHPALSKICQGFKWIRLFG